MSPQKISIITITKVNNYGAELQSFALQHKMQMMGADAEIIDYLFYKNREFRREKISEPFYPFPLKKRVKEYLLPIVEWIKALPNRKANLRRAAGFEAFHKKNTRFSQKRYRSYSELYNAQLDYDIYCVGSDQVWNPSCFTNLNPYFLTFAPKDKHKFSYASSFGVSSIPESAKEGYQLGLNNLDCISVRERSGVSLVKQIANKEATEVVDPTLLLSSSEWHQVASTNKVPRGRYLLIYTLTDSPIATQAAIDIAKEKGLNVVRICKGAYVQDKKESGITNIIDAAPDDFIGLFEHADFVVTNSFHGTVFSLIFNRQFLIYLKRGKANNSRQEDLLKNVELSNRIVYEGDEPNKDAIDFSQANALLANLKEKSEAYLKKNIE